MVRATMSLQTVTTLVGIAGWTQQPLATRYASKSIKRRIPSNVNNEAIPASVPGTIRCEQFFVVSTYKPSTSYPVIW